MYDPLRPADIVTECPECGRPFGFWIDNADVPDRVTARVCDRWCVCQIPPATYRELQARAIGAYGRSQEAE